MLGDTTTCFVTQVPSGGAHYRAALPAYLLGAGLLARDAKLNVVKDTPPLDADVYIVALPRYDHQAEEQRARQSEGAKLLVDIDDDLTAIAAKTVDHEAAHTFTPEMLEIHDKCIREADGVTVSTPHLAHLVADRHDVHPSRIFVCPNGVDLPRFAGGGDVQAQPPPNSIVIGWSGSTGHGDALASIADELNACMEKHPRAFFVSIGHAAADLIEDQDRCAHVPWQSMKNHAAVLRSFDINIGPALDDAFYRAKSDLRFLEAAAAGTVFLGSRVTYGDAVLPGHTGVLYGPPDDFGMRLDLLLSSRELRRRIARAAAKWAIRHAGADAPERIGAWASAIRAVAAL